MSNRYSSIESINRMLAGKYSKEDIAQALADLTAMYEADNISEYQYKSMKALIQAKQ